MKPLRLCALAAWAAVVTALAELAMRAIQKFPLHRYIYLSRDVLWLTPLADLAVFGIFAILLGVGSIAFPQLRSLRVVATTFGFLGSFGILTLQPWMTWWGMLALALGIGLQIGTLAARHEQRAWLIVRRSAPVVAAIAVVLGLGTRLHLARAEQQATASLPPAPTGAPNVLIIVWDAVRARNLGLYGYGRATTPNLSTLAARGTVFERAISTAPYTLPTHASLFTGLWPHQLEATWTAPLEAHPPTLAEALAARGYRTGAFSANHILVTWEHGVLRGFSHAEDYTVSWGELARSSALLKWLLTFDRLRIALGWYDAPGRRDAEDIRSSFLRWLDRGEQSRPYFAFLNLYDAHGPYLPPAPFDTLFGWPPGGGAAERQRIRAQALVGPADLPVREVARQIDQYDGAITQIDHQFGQLLEDLRRRHLLDNTLVIVAGDHGEAFGEHGAFEHGNDVYLEEIEVPLVMALPGSVPAGIRVPGVVSLRDVPATIGTVLGAATGDPWPLPGRSLSRLWQVPLPVDQASDTVLSEVDQIPRGSKDWYPVRRGNVRSILAWPWHLITVAGDVELYRLDTDAAEQHNLAGDPAQAANRDRLLAALLRWRQDAVPGKAGGT